MESMVIEDERSGVDASFSRLWYWLVNQQKVTHQLPQHRSMVSMWGSALVSRRFQSSVAPNGMSLPWFCSQKRVRSKFPRQSAGCNEQKSPNLHKTSRDLNIIYTLPRMSRDFRGIFLMFRNHWTHPSWDEKPPQVHQFLEPGKVEWKSMGARAQPERSLEGTFPNRRVRHSMTCHLNFYYNTSGNQK